MEATPYQYYRFGPARLASRLPLQVLRTDSASFAAATEARRNRRDAFYQRPAGHIDLCNIPLPSRLASAP